MQSLQDESKPAAGRYPPAAGDADLEAGSLAQVPLMPEGALRAAGPHDQADRGAEHHALQMGASDRRKIAQ